MKNRDQNTACRVLTTSGFLSSLKEESGQGFLRQKDPLKWLKCMFSVIQPLQLQQLLIASGRGASLERLLS